jgi:hypothetical protein
MQAAVHRRPGGGGRFRVAVEISDLVRGLLPAATVRDQAVTTKAPASAIAARPRAESRMSVEDVFAGIRAA